MGRGRSRVIGRLIFLSTKLKHARLWNEVSSLWKDLCARNFGSCMEPSSLPAGTSFPTQRNGKFQAHAFASYSNLCCFQSPYQVLGMWSVWIIWASRDFMPSCDSLRDVVVNYCIALFGPPYLWFNLRRSFKFSNSKPLLSQVNLCRVFCSRLTKAAPLGLVWRNS